MSGLRYLELPMRISIRRHTLLASFVLASFAAALPAVAQQKRASPHETISSNFDQNRVTIVYGRPYSKDPRTGEKRKIWGTLVPYGKVWRLGADEATLFITQKDLDVGGTTVPAGAYTLDLQPEEDGSAKLIINKAVGQWGIPYTQQASELARIDLKKETLDHDDDQLTLSMDRNPSGGGILKIQWETTQYSVPFAVKK
jgi:hypothetical protein